jgi:cyclopropane fatty-acyl-phospholipid synthase-like methyltransferase
MIRRLFFELQYLLKKTPWDTGISPPELIDFLDNNHPGRVLDLGCGTGTNVTTMAKYGWDAVGMDISALAIRAARQKARTAGAKALFMQGDVTNLKEVEGTFDLILDIGCFHAISVPSKMTYAENLSKLLRPEGTFLLYTWLQQDIDGDKTRSPEEKLLDLFGGCCECINIVRGSDWASHHSSAWFTMRRTS